ncbi:hypothetical protein K3495_g2635 [Podosphaera aphanis]|nr:hypothetical protein K3495_g2635 [Podosphaera aphanis]
MVSRKRGRQGCEDVEPPKEIDLLHRIRNMWEFANLMQWIYTFGRAVKISEDLDIEEIEAECLKPSSTVLSALGLALLKYVSSHRGLTPEIFDEITRRQYTANAPHRNPFGDQDEPAKFDDFDVFTKIRVLQQLTQWIMKNPERIREKMDEQKDAEQTIWRIEQFGWDSEDRTYVVLDDNRLYRRTDPQIELPPTKLKSNSKKAKVNRRDSRRSQASEIMALESKSVESSSIENLGIRNCDEGLGGMKWECIAVNLEEYNTFLSTLENSRDPNEQVLRKRIIDDVIPFLKKQEEARQRKQAQKRRELLNLEKLACAKRSSRIAGRMEQQKLVQEARDAERKKDAELAMASKQQQKWTRSEMERESRIITREQRLKDREARRILHEKDSTSFSDGDRKTPNADRFHEYHLKLKKQSLKKLHDDDEWIFDCICGAYGRIDDGTHSIACDGCGTWQHSKCVQVSKVEAERDDFSFICNICEERAKDDADSKKQLPIKIKLSRPGQVVPLSNKNLSSPPSENKNHSNSSSSSPNSRPQNLKFTMDSPSDNPLNPDQQISSQMVDSQQFHDLHTPNSPRNSKPCPDISKKRVDAKIPAELNQEPISEVQTLNTRKNHDLILQISNENQTNSQDDIAIIPQTNSCDKYRRSSTNIPSPFAEAPKLSPDQKKYPNSTYSGPKSPLKNSLSSQHLISNSPSRASPIIDGSQSEFEHALALPPAVTGISPTKTSPPRSFVLSSGFGPKTPTMLPPVVSLTPSPKAPNLSPPVKSSEQEWSRPAGQFLGQ